MFSPGWMYPRTRTQHKDALQQHSKWDPAAAAASKTSRAQRNKHLATLELSEQNPSHEAIRSAYLRKAAATHPDKGGSASVEEFLKVKAAYEALSSAGQKDF